MSQASLDHAKLLYESILGRDPSAMDQANFATYLDDGGNGAAAVADSPEAASQVREIYDSELGRPASSSEIATGQSYLASGGTLAGLRDMAAVSLESGATVNALYVNGLGRNASGADFQGAETYLKTGGTVAGLREMIGQSDESKAVVNALYQSVLGRSASAADVSEVQLSLRGGTTLQTIYGALVSSPENRAKLAATAQQATGSAPTATTVATMEAQELSNGSSVLATVERTGPALSIPNPTPPALGFYSSATGSIDTALTSGAFNPIEVATGTSPPIAEITGVSLGTADFSSMTFISSSGNVTLTGGLVPAPTGPETVSVTTNLLGITLPASVFAPASADASGHFTLTSARDLPNGTYALSLTTTAPDGTTTAGHAATLVIAAPNAVNAV